MTSKSSAFTRTDAVRMAHDVWGLESSAESLAGELDHNFLLTTASGERFVLKASPVRADEAAFECQVGALEFLAESNLSDLVPRVVPTLDGRGLSPFGESDRDRRWVRVVSYLDGTPLADHGERPATLLEEIGRTLARLDRVLAGFDHPGTRREIPWDIERMPELAEHAQQIADGSRREMVEDHVRRFRQLVAPRLGTLERSTIHNDANDYNLLVRTTAGGRPTLAGLIDFGDLLHSITIAELAIACAYLMLDRDDPLSTVAQVVTGYHWVRPLSRQEQETLFDLIVARLCTSVLMSARNLRDRPDNEYLQVSAEPVWRLLERLTTLDAAEATRTVEDACRGFAAPVRDVDEIVALRRRHLGPNLSVAYTEPLKIVRGRGCYLFDDEDRRYLDLVNNVCHVGHCHPRVVAAAQRQIAELNTNTRYLHDNLTEYARRLASTLPDPLEVCFFVCSGTEANDLALRLARAHTGSREIVVLDHAYHGHSPSLIEISPYKCEGPGGEGLAGHAHKVPMPDPYRGPFRGSDSGRRYAEKVGEAIERSGKQVGAFIAESWIGCGGQVIPPDGFLAAAHEIVRSAGGVCIADEVQVGFGRAGTHFWAFEAQGAIPDIVTLGKPIGNGHPMAAVVTTREIATSFDTGMEYFNTFGGNPVSCAVGLAMLDVIEREDLQRHALEAGKFLLEGLRALAERHALVGDVRGRGLFAGVELVRDRTSLEPADREAAAVVDEMRQRGFLLSTDGPLHNVIKIKPPLVIEEHDIDDMLGALDEVLGDRV